MIEKYKNLRKPYSLKWLILNTLKQRRILNVYDIADAVKDVYKIDAVKKCMKKMEDNKLIQSYRENKIKYYSLAEKGIAEINRMENETNGLTESKYYEIIYKWDKATEKGKLVLNEELIKNAEKNIKFEEEKYIKGKESVERSNSTNSINNLKLLKELRFYGLVCKVTYTERDSIGLVIQRVEETEKLLRERIELITKTGFKFKKIYVVILDTIKEYQLPQEINSTKIERFEFKID